MSAGVSGHSELLAATRAMQGLLFGVEPVDGITYAGVVAFVIGMAAIAVYWPARRAAAVQVSALLRRE